MNIGIEAIASYIPGQHFDNKPLKDVFSVDDTFLTEKIGVLQRSVKAENETTSDMCVKAYTHLIQNTQLDLESIECCVVVTQNPDTSIPHTSAIVHGKLGLPDSCASFDIALGCSGYVYALGIVSAFMQQHGMKKGLLFTADPYSDIIDSNDKNTALLFGDAATVTLLSDTPVLNLLDFSFGTRGEEGDALRMHHQKLRMNGRAVFAFSATTVPPCIESLLKRNHLTKEDIRRFYLHQGSRYIVRTIAMRLRIDPDRVPFDMLYYGNTVSSSIPLLLEKEIASMSSGYFVLSGFGVGLSWACAIIQKK
jgi:3-oxoacyl-[acyl-carrier-protein] synthase-3